MGEKKKPAFDAKLEKLAHEAAEAHEYQNPVHGKCGVCGYGPDVSRHLSSASRRPAEAPGPLAEIWERTFGHEADGAMDTFVGDGIARVVSELWTKAQAAGFTPVDITLTVEVTPVTERGGVALKPPRPHVRATVRAWKAVEL